jgi:hypothetical protein
MLRRTVLAAAVVAVAVAVAPPPAAAAPGFTDEDYWAFVERSFTALDAWWSPEHQAYREPGRHPLSIRVNAGMLTIHAIAAHEGHMGLARNDARARTMVRRLTSPPVWLGGDLASMSSNSVCWSENLSHPAPGHAALEPKVAAALAWAWRARRQLALPVPLVRRIEHEVGACAMRPYWALPPAVENQINWEAELYAAGATVRRSGGLLRSRYRSLIGWFADGITHPSPGMATSNLGPSYTFHYLPKHVPGVALNTDVPEYANITAQFIEFYDRAVAAGMRPLSGREMTLLRAWIKRLVAGSWTHSGMMNWDTGYGWQRWYSAQYWAFAQQGLLAIASAPRLRRAATGRWAKAMFDRALLLYRRWADEHGSALAPELLYGIHSRMESSGCYCIRMPLNAARAVALGLGDRPSEDPPPLYAYDFDTGRLAITTPRYATAIVPDNHGAFPYGGIELARLFGRDGRVAANIGGLPPAAFGLMVSGPGRSLLDTQHARTRPLRILRSPHGRLTAPRRYPASPDAGRFGVVVARGTVVRPGVTVTATHRFTRDSIRVRRDVRCTTGACRQARALFPTWRAGAAIVVQRRRGADVALEPGDAAIRLRDVARIRLESGDGDAGYTVVPLDGFGSATVRALRVGPQPTNPHPGPTLVLDQPLHGRGGATLTVRLEPFA